MASFTVSHISRGTDAVPHALHRSLVQEHLFKLADTRKRPHLAEPPSLHIHVTQPGDMDDFAEMGEWVEIDDL